LDHFESWKPGDWGLQSDDASTRPDRPLACRLSRIPGKGLSEKTLPIDRAVANHLKVAEGLCPTRVVHDHHQRQATKMAPEGSSTCKDDKAEIHKSAGAGPDVKGDSLFYKVDAARLSIV